MLWNAKSKPEGFCVVRPTEFFGKFAPFNRSKARSTRITETNCIVLPPEGRQLGSSSLWRLRPERSEYLLSH
jgi:hypothetical protein